MRMQNAECRMQNSDVRDSAMKNSGLLRRVVGCLIAIAMAFAVPLEPLGQSGAARPVPRAANGKPDLSGIWIANGALRLMAGDEEVKRMQQADAAAGRKPLPPPEP